MKPPADKIRTLLFKAAAERRIVRAPLMGFPGIRLTGSTVKIAQQNCREHFRAIQALYDKFTPDVVFPLMDLSVEANALGFYTVFPVDDTPTVVKSDVAGATIERLSEIDISYDARIMGYVETLRLLSLNLPKEVLKGAFVTGPFTLAALMMGAENAAMAALADIDRLHTLCEFTTGVIRKYTRNLVAAGAEAVCLLEPSAVILGPEQFREFSVGYSRRVITECDVSGVSTIYHTCGNTTHLLEEMVHSGVTAISLDSPEAGIDIDGVMRAVPPSIGVMGNINPTKVMLHGTVEEVHKEVAALLDAAGGQPNFILSTGCDLPLETPHENIAAFMQAAGAYRRETTKGH
ncbi:MAG: uroporphyrinogen decarboxylase family protein [Chitinispirillaceae bacterium]|nr:uroporphyrinogen decarboxylase family protein [Chitinispirillaceae bacterium]